MKTIYARNCEIQELTELEANEFIDLYHRSKAIRGSNTNIGIFKDGELLGVAQFGYPRTSLKAAEYSSELYRLAFKDSVRVVGGASKMIKAYITRYKPTDFFTYQDTTGENTEVYTHAGMTLVTDGLKSSKTYLVAPGKTIATGDRKEVLGLAYATRYGPDRILGTKLGEVFDDTTGKRKSNKQLFLEELGWHTEITTGDSVYEWIDPNRTFYTYKITAADSEKYYYGVSHVKKANASIEDCLNDGYYGSGEEKFKNWKKRHRDSLLKEIIALHISKGKALAHEKKLIGLSYQEDKNCLNSNPGGGRTASVKKTSNNVAVRECPLHGESKFQGDTCRKCLAKTMITEESCPVHGESKHRWGKCTKCSAAKIISMKKCPIHGETKFKKDNCVKCYSSKIISKKQCSVHGLVNHRKDSCMKCIAQKVST